MNNTEIEQTKAAIEDSIKKLNAIDTKAKELETQLQKLAELKAKGLAYCAFNMKKLDSREREKCFTEIEPELAEQIKRNMFSFQDLATLDRRFLQKVLFKCELKDIACALKLLNGTEVKRQIYSNVSKNNLKQIRHEENILGDDNQVDKNLCREAQQKILQVAFQMESEGEIFFPEDFCS